MAKYNLDITASDIGEIIEMIRVQYLKIHTEPFARKIGVEEGRGPHGVLLLKKINDAFPNIKVTLNVEIK